MELGGLNNPKLGSESQDSDDPQPSGSSAYEKSVLTFSRNTPKPGKNMAATAKGVENAKKRLRAFSIQKKSSLSPVTVPKPVNSGNTTVLIGKLTSAKTHPKPEPDPAAEQKKLPKPPKPGTNRVLQESYMFHAKETKSEIEDMKRKMEMVDLGIPLGLICPAPDSDKAMPTKAMPPIKTFIAPAKVDELIREAKKARAEGREFKFDYQKLLPDYDNPFQRKKDDPLAPENQSEDPKPEVKAIIDKDKRRGDKFAPRRFYGFNKEDMDRYRDDKYRDRSKDLHEDKYRDKSKDSHDNRSIDREKEKSRDKDGRSRDKDVKHRESDARHKDNRSRDRDDRPKERDTKPRESDNKSKEKEDRSKERDKKSKDSDLKEIVVCENDNEKDKETHVNLKDFVVCDSWSENEEKSKDSTPRPEEKKTSQKENKEKISTPVRKYTDPITPKYVDPMEQLRKSLTKKGKGSPKPKMEKLKPVIDSFKYEIDPNDPEDDVLEIIDKNSTIDKFSKIKPKVEYESPIRLFDYKDESLDDIADASFLESVINEIKQEDIDEASQDKGLVDYDESPTKDSEIRESITPELDDIAKERYSSRSYYSDGYKSVESGCKSVDSGCKSVESGYKSTDSGLRLERMEKGIDDRKLAKCTVDSLETWSFVLKICQPLLFRHDKNKCYKETRSTPKLWFTENPKVCSCVKDRRIVYEELEMCKSELVDNLYNSEQVPEAAYPTARDWYPPAIQAFTQITPPPHHLSSEWDADDSRAPPTPRGEEIMLDKEYQRFMQAVWPEVTEPMSETPRSTPVRQEGKKKADDEYAAEKKAKKMKLSSEGWSQESDVEEQNEKRKKLNKEKRKRKHSTSTSVAESSEGEAKKRKKAAKKKDNKKSKSKVAKKQRLSKKLTKLKDKQKKKKKIIMKLDVESDLENIEKEKKKKDKKAKKKKQQKKKTSKKKKSKVKSSSSSSESSSESDSELEKIEKKRKKKSAKKKKRKRSSSESTQEELFDVNILNNIKTERLTDDERLELPRKKPREIINVKELQNDFVGNSIRIKQEVEEKQASEESQQSEQHFSREESPEIAEKHYSREESKESAEKHSSTESPEESLQSEKLSAREESHVSLEKHSSREESQESVEKHSSREESQEATSEKISSREESPEVPSEKSENVEVQKQSAIRNEFKEPEETSQLTPLLRADDTNLSQCSSQDSLTSFKEQTYEKDESHLRPSSQNSNYSFHDVMHSGMYQKHLDLDCEGYEGNYEMYEQMAMAYQSDVASKPTSPVSASCEQRIETVVRARSRGEIKCDWRAGDSDAAPPAPPPAPPAPLRPSRWGLKPGEVNIVLTGGNEQFPIQTVVQPVYKIQSLANRTDNSNTGYDEAYMAVYAASDRLQYGDCFAAVGQAPEPERRPAARAGSSLDDRIDLALRTTVLGEVAKEGEENDDRNADKGILVTKSLAVPEARGAKRVSFADGYKPGQDSDVEEPPVKKKKKSRRTGCAWPCPATHPDHVPLWDALPPPPPPPGSPPPPPAAPPPPTHLLRQGRPGPAMMLPPPPHGVGHKCDPNSLAAFLPPEPPPGLITF